MSCDMMQNFILEVTHNNRVDTVKPLSVYKGSWWRISTWKQRTFDHNHLLLPMQISLTSRFHYFDVSAINKPLNKWNTIMDQAVICCLISFIICWQSYKL